MQLNHKHLSLIKEIIFHEGRLSLLKEIIVDTKVDFDCHNDGVEREKELESYVIKSINTSDYSTIPRKFYLIIGGMDENFSEDIQIKCAEECLVILKEYLREEDIRHSNKGYVIKTPQQNVPNIIQHLVEKNLGVYGVIPVE